MLEKKLDFIGLQETIKSQYTKNDLHSLCGGRNFIWHWAPPRGRSGGIIFGINGDVMDVIQVEVGEYFDRILVFDKIAKFNWNLITMYGDAQIERKAAFSAELSRVYQDNPLPCLLGGDFNIIGKSYEKNKPNDPYHWSFVFNAIIEHAGLREMPLNGRNFT